MKIYLPFGGYFVISALTLQEGFFFPDLPFNTVKFYLPNWTEYCKESTVLWSLWSESLRIRESDKHRDNMFWFQRVPSLGHGLQFQHPKITIITDYSFNSFYVSHPTQWFTTDYSFNSRSDGPSVTGARTSRTPTPILRHYHLLAAKSPALYKPKLSWFHHFNFFE